MMLQKYTVLMLYPDYLTSDYGQDTYLAWVYASDPLDARQEAQIQAAESNGASVDDPEDFLCLSIFKGHLDNYA